MDGTFAPERSAEHAESEKVPKVGIAAYLDDLASRLRSIAHRCNDGRAQIALQDLSVEVSNKAFGLGEVFTFSDSSGRQRPAHKR